MKIRTLMLALALTACGQNAEKAEAPASPPEQPDAMTLNIEIGRYGVMLSQVHGLSGEGSGADTVADATDPQIMARALREPVWEFNLERSRLCASGLYTEISCVPAFAPVWIGEPPTATPTLEELQARSNAVGEEVIRLWNTVCEDARARETDEDARMFVCAME
jgi:hypothetical protein